MKILYLLKRDPDATERAIMDAHRSGHTVQVVDVRSERDWGAIVGRIFAADKVISW